MTPFAVPETFNANVRRGVCALVATRSVQLRPGGSFAEEKLLAELPRE